MSSTWCFYLRDHQLMENCFHCLEQTAGLSSCCQANSYSSLKTPTTSYHLWEFFFFSYICLSIPVKIFCWFWYCLCSLSISLNLHITFSLNGLPRWLQCRRSGFDPWVRKMPLGKGMATRCSFLSWRIPWTEEPGGLSFMGSQRVGLYWVTNAFSLNMPVK